MRLPAPSMIPKCRALTRVRLTGGALPLAVVDAVMSVILSLEDGLPGILAGAGGASQSQSTSSATTGTPQNTKLAVQASLTRKLAIMGRETPAATASPMINPSLNSAATSPI